MEDINKIFEEIDFHLLNDSKPSLYFNTALKEGRLDEYPFTMLSSLKDIEQNPEHHPEGSVWNHTMLVVDNAAAVKEKSRDKRVFMWGAILHDIGKAKTTKLRKGRITSYDHDKVGEELAEEFFKNFNETETFVMKVVKLVRWHMQTLFVVKDMPFADVKTMKSETSVDEIALLSFCDRLGREPISSEKKKEERKNINKFLSKVGR